jgi:hypothetical protein
MADSYLALYATSTISPGNVAVNTWNVKTVPQGSTTAEVNAIITAIRNFYTGLTTLFATVTTWTVGAKVLSYSATVSDPPVIMGGTPLTTTSGTGGTPMPPQLATCVSWRTALAGRRYRGRTYVGPLGSNAFSQNIISAGAVSAANTAAATLITAVAAAGSAGKYALAVLHNEFTTPTPPAKPVRINYTLEPIISGTMDNVPDTMRSRVR